MFDEWAAEGLLTGISINETRNVLNQIFKRAYHDEVIDKNPVEGIERYKQETIEPKPFNQQEIKRIIKELPEPYSQFFQFAIYTGLRWEDVDLDREVVHIRVNITSGIEKAPKTIGSIRTVELHPTAVNAIEPLKTTGYVDKKRGFIDPRTMATYKYADGLRKYVWKPSLEWAGVSYRYPYQCRHTYASMTLSQGKNPMWVARQMGNADWGMIRKVYTRWKNSSL